MKKVLCFILILTVLGSVCMFFGCKNDTPKYSEVETENYIYFENISYANHSRAYLDLCLPKGKVGELGAIVCIHGGAWVSGDKSGYETLLKTYAEQGYACISMNYRYISKDVGCADILEDITNALTVAKSRASDYQIDIKKMITTGGSAGAHLALLYAYSCQNISPIQAVGAVSLAGPTDLVDVNYYNNARFKNDICKWFSYLTKKEITCKNYSANSAALLEISPINYVNSDTVPTIICHGDSDEIVPYSNAVSLDTLLNENEVAHEFITFKNSGHGLSNDSVANAVYNAKLADFISELLD